MADFPDIMLTEKGLNMVALAQAGQQLIFTKIVLGNAVLPEDADILTLTDVISPKLNLDIASVTSKNNGQVDIEARVNNAELKKGFFCRECGVYAKIGEDGIEQLYSYTNAGSFADYLPPNTNAYNDIFIVSTVVGNSTDIKLVFDDSIIYATNKDLQEHNLDEQAHNNILSKAVPAGTVLYFANSTPPEGYLKCNGAKISREEYNRLFNAIGTIFGEGDGVSTFNLPDLRGEFIRGWDDERGIDVSREFASWQPATGIRWALGSFTPSGTNKDVLVVGTSENYPGDEYFNDVVYSPRISSGNYLANVTYKSFTTRPRNVALLACIKY